MKGTEKIIAHIMADAQSEADAILSQAGQQCEEIRATYARRAEEAYGEKIRAGVKACQEQVDSRERIVKMELRKDTLALKQEMVSKGFERARELIAQLPSDKMSDFLARLAADAAVTGDEQIVLNARDVKIGEAVVKKANALVAEKGLKGALSLAPNTGDFDGGLVLSRGNIQTNCTLELLIEMCRGELSATLAGVLFD